MEIDNLFFNRFLGVQCLFLSPFVLLLAPHVDLPSSAKGPVFCAIAARVLCMRSLIRCCPFQVVHLQHEEGFQTRRQGMSVAKPGRSQALSVLALLPFMRTYQRRWSGRSALKPCLMALSVWVGTFTSDVHKGNNLSKRVPWQQLARPPRDARRMDLLEYAFLNKAREAGLARLEFSLGAK